MATPYADYKVSATNENWQPLAGVEIEAMNLATLLADSVQTTGLDGVATFTGLPAGPHFFRVRATRVSTKVGQRTYIGRIHLQVIAWAGIVKHAVVDANGFGTHTTVQAAADAVSAQAAAEGGGEYVIHVNPGWFSEDVVIPDLSLQWGLIIEAQNEQTQNLATLFRREGAVLVAFLNSIQVSGAVRLVLREIGVSTVTGLVGVESGEYPHIVLRQVRGESEGPAGTDITTPGPVTAIDSWISDLLLQPTGLDGNPIVVLHGCLVDTIYGLWTSLRIDHCISTGLIEQSADYAGAVAVSSALLQITDSVVEIVVYGSPIAGARSQDIIFVGNQMVGSNLTLRGVAGGVITGNKFREAYLYGVRFEKDVDGNANDGIFCGGNSYDNCPIGVSTVAGAVGTGTKIGPDAFDDTPIEYDGVPSGSMSYAHTLLDGSYHTDTLLGVVLDGDIIIGNVTPKWSRLAISIPAANVRNVLGIDNAELRPSWKTALDGTAPADIAAAGAAGTSLVFSHRDHVHAHPVFGSGALHPEYLTAAEAGALYELIGVAAGLIAIHAVLPDVHHAGFIGLTIAGPANIDPNAGDRITIEDTATVTWASSGAGKIAATSVGGMVAHDLDGALHTGVADYTSILGLASLTIADANFGLALSGADPRITVDVGDYLGYIRASNYFSFVPGTVESLRVGATYLSAVGYARVGSLSAPTNTTAGDLTAARGMFGDQVSFSSQRIFWAFRSITETAAVSSQVASVSAIVAPVGASSADIRVLAVGTDCQQGANTLNVIMGANFENYVRGTGTITLLEGARYTGVVALAGAGNTVNITSANCQSIYLFYRADSSTVVCGTLQGINITAAPGNGVAGDAWASIRGIHIGNLGGTRTTYAFGILLEKQSGATSMNVGVFSYGATTAVLWVYNDTPSEGAIKWGTAGDTNLYRSAANVLATDDSLYAALHARIGSVTAPTNITAGDLTCARLFVNDAAAVAGIDALITGDMAISSQLVVGAAAAAVAGRALEVRQASPAANETELWLGEGTPETVRQVKWMDPGALGVNFVGGEKVLVLV